MEKKYQRIDYTFYSNNTKCVAWLYLPKGNKKCPIIVIAPGFGGVRSMCLDTYAEKFANAGYACFLFDYRNLGQSDGDKRQLIKAKDQLEDWNSAIDFVKTLDSIDSTKIILFGVSFSGGHVMTLSAKRNDITASIAQCPYTSGKETRNARSFKKIKPMIPKIIMDLLSCLKRGYHPVMIKLEGEKGEAAILQLEPEEKSLIECADKNSGYKNEIAARSTLEVFKYSPGKYAKEIKIPIFYAICTKDKMAPANKSRHYLEKSINGTINEYDCGHFEIFTGDYFNKVMSDYITFLNKYVK